MSIICSQMDILLAFYIEGDLSENLKNQVEEHLRGCDTCRAKYNILLSLFNDLKEVKELHNDEKGMTSHYRQFKSNLSAYVDNELSQDENIKIKKYAICNKKAKEELENVYRIRRLMKDSFFKTKTASNKDFSKPVLKNLNLDTNYNLTFSPLIKIGYAFVITVLVLSAIVIYIFSI